MLISKVFVIFTPIISIIFTPRNLMWYSKGNCICVFIMGFLCGVCWKCPNVPTLEERDAIIRNRNELNRTGKILRPKLL